MTASSSPASDSTTNSLRFAGAAGYTVTLSGTNVITTGGILETSDVGASHNNLITGGTLEGASGADLIVIQDNVNGSLLTIASAIADNGTATGLTKSGRGTLVLTGPNTYTGPTIINQGSAAKTGILQFGKEVSLYNNAPSSWTAGNIAVNEGATAAFNVGGTGEFTALDIGTLAGLGTATVASAAEPVWGWIRPTRAAASPMAA